MCLCTPNLEECKQSRKSTEAMKDQAKHIPAVSPGPVAANSNTTKLCQYIFFPPAKQGEYFKMCQSCHDKKKKTLMDSGNGGTL